MESILTSVKKLCGGIDEADTSFDDDIILYINSVFPILRQLGVGPAGGFSITDKSTKWSDYIGNNINLNDVRTYMALKVQLLFDPPQSSALIEVKKQLISELEFRLNTEVEYAT